ncbi:MAG: C25 family cysteine peptidase [Candidatus Thermoplasmatota archaeon]|nr:C25 family cysteine peptidase [Candidatus Thermoplasmatota archaeon]
MRISGTFWKFIGITIALSFTVTSFSSTAISDENNNEMNLNYCFEKPHIKKVCGESEYDNIKIEGCRSYDFSGVKLPVKPLHILIPQGFKVCDIKIEKADKIDLFSLYSEAGNGESISVNGTIPDRDFILVGTYRFRGYEILVLNLCPVKYTSDGGIFYWKHMTVNIGLQETSSKPFRGLPRDREIVMRMVDNPGIVESYRNSATITNTYEYIVITGSELKNASGSYNFQDLVDSKISKGINAKIVTVEEIVNNQTYWANGTWGDNNPSNPFYQSEITKNFSKYNDTQAKIRNFIRYTYFNLGTNYILLGGDADGGNKGNNIVPARRLYANETGLPLNGNLGFEEDDIPSDLYYACLDGNFNYDMDDSWGENASRNDLANVDEADFCSEIWIGRACVDSPREVENFVMKTLAYEQSNDSYTSKVLFLGEYLGFPGISKYGGNYKDVIKPYIPSQYDLTTMYDRDWPGFDPGDPWGTGWDKYDLMNVLNNDTPCIINHDGHGFVNYGLRLRTSDIETLTNGRYFFIYSQTCLAGSFDNCYNEHYYTNDCAAEYFTVETAHGAFAVIMNARYGLGSEDTLDSPSGHYDESFFKALFTAGIKELGGANHYSKEDNIWRINENGMRWACYETNLFGDPEVAIKQPSMGISIMRPENGFYLFDNGPLFPTDKTIAIGGITIKVNATALSPDAIDRVEFYVDGVLKATDNHSPYEWKWKEFAIGMHTVKVIGYTETGDTDSEEMEIFVICL